MKVLIVSATEFEVEPLKVQKFNGLDLSFLVTGVGTVQTTYKLTRELGREAYHLVINAGIAGTYNPELSIGTVVNIISECFADLGAEDKDGSFLSATSIGLLPLDQIPFRDGLLWNEAAAQFDFLPKAKGITVNTASGTEASIKAIKNLFNPDVESMEGAAVFYVCLLQNIPFLEIRAVSNLVEPRNREAWNIPLAIEKLNETLSGLLQSLV